MHIPIEAQKLKILREQHGLTQVEMAKKIQAGSSTVDIERGKSLLKGKSVAKLQHLWGINPLWLYGMSSQQYIVPASAPSVSPKTIVSDVQGNENIVLVHQKAAAGYGNNVEDAQYMASLPSFRIPLPAYQNQTFRGFQIEGDSMVPLVYPGEWVLVTAVEEVARLKNGQVYIFVDEDSVRLKTLKIQDGRWFLISKNPEYPDVEIVPETLVEVWKLHSKISSDQFLQYNEHQEEVLSAARALEASMQRWQMLIEKK